MTTGIGLLALASTLAGLGSLVRSDLAWYRLQTAFAAFAALFVAAGVARETHPVQQRLVFLLMTFAAARLVVASFPAAGRVHVLLAAAALGSAAWAAAILPDRVAWEHGLLVVLGWVVVVTAAACGLALAPALARPFPLAGTIERLFSAAALVWLAAVSVHFL